MKSNILNIVIILSTLLVIAVIVVLLYMAYKPTKKDKPKPKPKPKPNPKPPCFENVEYGGRSFEVISTVDTAGNCQKNCKDTADCKFWTFAPTLGYCYLKRSKGTPVKSGAFISGPKVCPQ